MIDCGKRLDSDRIERPNGLVVDRTSGVAEEVCSGADGIKRVRRDIARICVSPVDFLEGRVLIEDFPKFGDADGVIGAHACGIGPSLAVRPEDLLNGW